MCLTLSMRSSRLSQRTSKHCTYIHNSVLSAGQTLRRESGQTRTPKMHLTLGLGVCGRNILNADCHEIIEFILYRLSCRSFPKPCIIIILGTRPTLVTQCCSVFYVGTTIIGLPFLLRCYVHEDEINIHSYYTVLGLKVNIAWCSMKFSFKIWGY